MNKKAQLKSIIKQCEETFARGSSHNWKHSDYIDFSSEIQKSTKVNISANTLKRIFGRIPVDNDYQPQQATLEALKEYCGFNMTFVNTAVPEITGIVQKKKSLLNLKTTAIFIILFFAIAAFIGIMMLNISVPFFAALKLQHSEGTLPKTCFFNLDVKNYSDSLFIDFGDKSPLAYIKPAQQSASHIYLFPGVFNAKIINSNDNTLTGLKVFIPSNKWLALGFQKQRDLPNSYYAFPAVKDKNGTFYITPQQLEERNVDISKKYYTQLCNYTAYSHNADNFDFETSFKKDELTDGIYCNSFQFKIVGIKNIIRINFVNAGCSQSISNIISEKLLKGEDNNLSQFVVNFKQWNTVRLINKNKCLSLFLNGKSIYTARYKKSLGEIRGLAVEFEKNGFIKNCSLKTLTGNTLYSF